MRIGLTGARGALGARLHAALTLAGHDVIPYVGDVRDMEALERWVEPAESVVHAAATVPVHKVVEGVADAISTNVAGTANVAKVLAARPGRRMTYISTSHVYALSAKPINEGGALEPVSLYGLSKLQGEQWVCMLLKGALIIRVFSFFDERQAESYLVPALYRRIKAAAQGAMMPLDGARNIRDMASAEWVADVCARLIGGQHCGVFNCGTGIGRTVSEIAETVAAALGRPDLRWEAKQATPANALIADPAHLVEQVGALPPFELRGALDRYVARRATAES
jgi:nucleoside-diphosphate-sugar epimerase